MTWIWLNIPLAAIAFGLVAGIPMWLIMRTPEQVLFGSGEAGEELAPAAPYPLETTEVQCAVDASGGPPTAGVLARGSSQAVRQAGSLPVSPIS